MIVRPSITAPLIYTSMDGTVVCRNTHDNIAALSANSGSSGAAHLYIPAPMCISTEEQDAMNLCDACPTEENMQRIADIRRKEMQSSNQRRPVQLQGQAAAMQQAMNAAQTAASKAKADQEDYEKTIAKVARDNVHRYTCVYQAMTAEQLKATKEYLASRSSHEDWVERHNKLEAFRKIIWRITNDEVSKKYSPEELRERLIHLRTKIESSMNRDTQSEQFQQQLELIRKAEYQQLQDNYKRCRTFIHAPDIIHLMVNADASEARRILFPSSSTAAAVT